MKTSARAIIIAVSLTFVSSHSTRSQLPRTSISALRPLASGDARKIALGGDLFLDRRLSRSMRLSCASCHDLKTNGATAAAVDRADSRRTMRFNTPTVFNSVYNFRFGWEGQSRTLRGLTLSVLKKSPMYGERVAVHRLAQDKALSARFRAIYGTPPNENNIADSLAAFMRTLVTPDAPFDRWMAGTNSALTAQQIRGYDRFKAIGCASCHQGANVGGNIFQRRGIFRPLGTTQPKYLRVPSLRNVTVTAPYFHDGSAKSLPEAIRQMATSQLNLSVGDRDVQDITAFLDSLTGSYEGRRLRPAADNP